MFYPCKKGGGKGFSHEEAGYGGKKVSGSFNMGAVLSILKWGIKGFCPL